MHIDESIYASEDATGNRNRAIAYLLLNCGIIDSEVNHTLHQYFSQCSLLVTAQNLAMMSATLANMGANPVMQDRVFDFNYIEDTLSVMFTCGLYDHAGEWAYRVGLPAKSGVSRGSIAVVNRQLGIAVYSPCPKRQRQQHPRHFGVHGISQPPGPARIRIHQCRVELHAVAGQLKRPSRPTH